MDPPWVLVAFLGISRENQDPSAKATIYSALRVVWSRIGG